MFIYIYIYIYRYIYIDIHPLVISIEKHWLRVSVSGFRFQGFGFRA